MYKLWKVLLILCAFFCQSILVAQENTFELLSTEKGLNVMRLTKMFKDSSGFVMFG